MCSRWHPYKVERPWIEPPDFTVSPFVQVLFHFLNNYELLFTLPMFIWAVAAAALSHVLTNQHILTSGPITVYLHHSKFPLCWKRTHSETGAKKVPQNGVLKTMMVHGSCSADSLQKFERL